MSKDVQVFHHRVAYLPGQVERQFPAGLQLARFQIIPQQMDLVAKLNIQRRLHRQRLRVTRVGGIHRDKGDAALFQRPDRLDSRIGIEKELVRVGICPPLGRINGKHHKIDRGLAQLSGRPGKVAVKQVVKTFRNSYLYQISAGVLIEELGRFFQTLALVTEWQHTDSHRRPARSGLWCKL